MIDTITLNKITPRKVLAKGIEAQNIKNSVVQLQNRKIFFENALVNINSNPFKIVLV